MPEITVVGCGYRREQLTFEAADALKAADRVILHTGRCAAAEFLEKQQIRYTALDALYDEAEDFDEHARMAAQAVMKAAESGSVAYAVFDVRDRSVQELLRLAGDAARVIAGPPVEDGLWAYARGATDALAASEWEDYVFHADRNALIREIDTRELAGQVKLKLMDCYPEQSEIYVCMGDRGENGLSPSPTMH